MRVLICGSRIWNRGAPISVVLQGLRALFVDLTIIEGEAQGADRLAGERAELIGIPVERYPADWDTHGRAAGPIRNQEMLDKGQPNLVWAFSDDIANSVGTRDMAQRAAKAGIPVYVVSRYRGK